MFSWVEPATYLITTGVETRLDQEMDALDPPEIR